MATIRRLVVTWQGLTALPGVSVFYAPAATDPSGDLSTFFNAIKTGFPTALTWQIPTTGDELSDVTGQLTGAWSPATPGTITGTGGAVAYAAGVGAYVNWNTGTIVNGRRLRGRTFLTHIAAGSYDSSGTIATASLAVFQGAATTLAAGGKLVVWHRPSPGGGGGSSAAIGSASVPDQVTSLRTRRR